MRPLRSSPCPMCGLNRVWSRAQHTWLCPDCDWTTGIRVARDQAIDEYRTSHRHGGVVLRNPNRWRP